MKKSSKSKLSAVPRVDPYLEGLVAKLVDRLIALERKVDTVISQTSVRISGGSEPSKPAAVHLQNQPPQRRDRTMYEAVCADCSKVCEVPFRPTEARPVYCKECFAKRKSGHSPNGMPVLTPVALPPKPAAKLHALFVPPAPASSTTSKKPKKIQHAKKGKKK